MASSLDSKKLILDAGCGAGRFTDELAQNGARVIALDMSSSVDACKETIDEPYEYSSTRGDVAIIQADLLKIPLKKEIFDGIHCAGVIQHTSDPKLVEQSLPKYLKPGGKLFYNFYEIDRFARFQVIKYGLRHWTPKWQPRTLAEFSRILCVLLFHLSWAMSRIRFVRFFNRFLPICSVHPRGIPLSRQFELTLLDTIDWYGPQYELRQDHKEVSELLTKEGLTILSADSGLVRAKKPNLPDK